MLFPISQLGMDRSAIDAAQMAAVLSLVNTEPFPRATPAATGFVDPRHTCASDRELDERTNTSREQTNIPSDKCWSTLSPTALTGARSSIRILEAAL